MPHIQIGSLVLAKGESLLRRVRAIKDDQARCEREDGTASWFGLKHLVIEPPVSQLKTYLL
jgi:hypothetical protein